MSNTESFIEEVTEEVRKDRLWGYVRRYGWIAVLAVVALVGGTAFNEYRKAQVAQNAQAAGDALLAALDLNDDAARAEALAAVQLDGDAGTVARLLQASNAVETGDTAAAVAALEEVALNSDTPAVYQDLAALKAAMVQEDLTAEDRRARFSALAQPGGTFRLVALEQLALMDVAAGETEAALDRFTQIAQDAEATRGLRDRAFSMIVALGGDLEALLGQTAAGAADGTNQ